MGNLQVIFSNRIEKLLDGFSAHITSPVQQLVTDFTVAEYVLIDNKMMGEWLNLQLAQQQGISANINYIQPSSLFWKLAKWLYANEVPHEAPLHKEEMKWRLFSLFADETLLQKPCMQPVQHYLAGEDSQDLKRYQLACSIADLFDQYLIFRPEWLIKWQENTSPIFAGDINEAWQQELWLRLVAIANANGKKGTEVLHRAAIEKKIMASLASLDSEIVRQKIPLQRLFVFGITSMPPSIVNLLDMLGRHIDITLYVLNPCQQYWNLIADAKNIARKEGSEEALYLEIGNPLLASQAVQVKEFIQQLQDVADPDFIEADELQPQTLLQAIQQEILNLTYRGTEANLEYVTEGVTQEIPEHDASGACAVPSIHIHQCHSSWREVEVLHDQLRDIFAKMPGLNPRDVVVMVPRVTDYVPYIHAVFNSIDESKRIPYHIIDRTMVEESPLLNSFETLLKLPESRMKLSEVLSILEVPAVLQRFGLDHAQFEQVRQWLIDSGVRWGLNAEHRETLGLANFHEYSWEFAINRMFSGYAMAVDDALSAESILPLSEFDYDVMPLDLIEGSSSAAFNSFLDFWKTLNDFRQAAAYQRSAGQWTADLLQLLADFYEPDSDEDNRALASLRSVIYELKRAGNNQWHNGNLSLPVVRDLLKPVLNQTASGRHHWQEGIKFCSLLPMRAVPFRVVFVLGMNLDDYPRRIEKKSFDLMRNRHQPGDRASRIDDRWLFLEALLSARDVFHVSYIAKDMHRNEKREPSVVLSELIDYIRYGYFADTQQGKLDCEKFLFTSHPLQPFSADYFRQDKTGLSPRLVSYNTQSFVIANAKYAKISALTAAERWSGKMLTTTEMEISLSEFVKFFSKPWDWFFMYKYRIDLGVADDGVDDDEAYGLGNGLAQWQMWDDLINKVNSQSVGTGGFSALLNEYIAVRKAKATWPVGLAADKIRDGFLDEKAVEFIYQSHGKSIEKIPFKYTDRINNIQVTIQGELPMALNADGERTLLFEHSASKVNDGNELAFLIKVALARQANIGLVEAECVYRDKHQKITPIQLSQLGFADFLKNLSTLFLEYQHSGLPFEPGLSKVISKLDPTSAEYLDEFDEKIDSAWFGGYNDAGLSGDLNKRTYFGSVEALRDKAFVSVCNIIGVFVKAVTDSGKKPVKIKEGE